MAQTDPTKKLYDAISERGLYSKSYDQFQNQFNSTEKIKKLHGTLRDRELVSISQDEFQNKYFSGISGSDGNAQEKSPSQYNITTDQQQVKGTPSKAIEASQNVNMGVTEGADEAEGNRGPVSGFNAQNAGSPGMADQIGEFINSTLRAGMSGVGQFIEGLGTAAEQGRQRFGDIGTIQIGDPNREGADRSIFTNIGREIEDTAKELFPDNPEVQNNFVNTTVPEALGSTMSFIGSSVVGGTPLTIINGGVQMAQTAFEDAKQHGADDEEAMNAFFWNMPLGGIEAFPAAKLLKRFNKASGGSLTQVVKEGGVGGVEEMMQESTQEFLSNVAAQNIYDESRNLVEGVGEGGAAGFVVGAMLNSIGASARNIRNNPNAMAEEKAEAARTEEMIQEKKNELETEDPITNGDPRQNNPFLPDLNLSESGQQRQTQEAIEAQEITLNGNGQEVAVKIEADQEIESPERIDDPAKESDEEAQRRGRTESREEKSGFNQNFLKEIEENTEHYFKTVTNEDLRKPAKKYVGGLVDQFGFDKAVEAARKTVFNQDMSLSLAQRFAIGREVISRLNDEHVKRLENEDPTAVNLSDRKLKFIEDFDVMATDAGRAIQSLNYGSGFMPNDFVRMYERMVNEYNSDRSMTGKAKKWFRGKILDKEPVEAKQEVINEITKRANKLKDIPEGHFREKAARDIFRYMNDQLPTNMTELGVAVGYANILSSHETHAVNFGNTGLNVLFEAISLNVANPNATQEIWGSLISGFGRGRTESKAALKGESARRGNVQSKGIKEQSPLEELFKKTKWKKEDSTLKKAGKTLGKIPATLRWVKRIMVASDVLWFKSAQDMRSAVLARNIAEKEGLTDQNEISKRVNEILHNTDELKVQAKEQAKQEGFGGVELEQRTNEIVEQNRPTDIQIEAQEFANKARYTQEPEGVLGAATKGVEYMTKYVPPLKAAVPFTRVVANVANNLIDYSPAGYTRLFAATKWGLKIKNVPEGDLWTQQAAKATMGTMGMMTAAMMNALNQDEDEPAVYFHGRGPRDYRQRYQMQETGWKPYSIQVGDKYISYKETIFALPLAVVGNYYDAKNYDNLSEEDLAGRVAFALNNSPRVIMDQSFLTGLSDLFTALSNENVVDDERPIKTVIDKGRAFAIPNAVKKIDQMFDPRVMTSDNIKEALIRDLPFARQAEGKPILNVLGEPIRQDYSFQDRVASRFYSTKKRDPIWSLVAKKNAFIPSPQQGSVKITDYGGDVRDLNPTEFYNFTILRGRYIKRAMQTNLNRLIYMDNGEAQDFVRKIARSATSDAKEKLKNRRLLGRDKVLEPND